MADRNDSDYFARRANQEGLRSLSAEDDRVSAAHAEMAERYYQRAQAARTGARTPLTAANDVRPDR